MFVVLFVSACPKSGCIMSNAQTKQNIQGKDSLSDHVLTGEVVGASWPETV